MRIRTFLIASLIMIVLLAIQGDIHFAPIVVTVYAITYLVPELFAGFRGIAYRKIWVIILLYAGLHVSGVLVTTYLQQHHQIEMSGLAHDFFFGLKVLSALLAIDRTPPEDKSKNKKASEAIKKVLDKIKAVYGSPTPIPVRS